MSAPALDTTPAPALPTPRKPPSPDVEGLEACRLIARGYLRKTACAKAGVSRQRLHDWVERSPSFRDRYSRACIAQAHALAEEVIKISDLPVGGKDAMAQVQRNRLRADNRKWYVSKIAPKLYGDRIEHEHKHTVGVVMLPPLTSQASGQVRLPVPDTPDTPEVRPQAADGYARVLDATPEVLALQDGSDRAGDWGTDAETG